MSENNKKPWRTRQECPISLDNQSVEIEPGTRISHFVLDGKEENLVRYEFEDARTTHEGFKRGLRVSNDGPCLGCRTGSGGTYEWITYGQVYTRAHHLGSGLLSKGVSPGGDTYVGIYAANGVDWVVSDQACAMYSMVSVPLYDTLGKGASSYIINQTEMSTVLCDKPEKATALLQEVDKTPSLKRIVLFESVPEDLNAEAEKHQVQVISIQDLENIGADNLQDETPPKASDVATVCYTSGTTGNPKGVVLTHEALVAQAASINCMTQVGLSPDDLHISYLPLAHMLERESQVMVFMYGAKVAFFSGDIRKLADDIAACRPTLFATVPRLLNRIYDKVQADVMGNWFKWIFFKMALNRKLAMLRSGKYTRTSIWDQLVFGKIQAMMGGRLRTIAVGSAPLAANVLDFTRAAFGCQVMEGYGLTEMGAGVSMTLPWDTQACGHVGAPVPCCAIKLVDVPEMDYFAKDNIGEICARGPSRMKEYFKNPDMTAETLDEDGWLHTGDVGMWLPNGTLKIVDRKKHIFKLAQGEYLAPEKIEIVYSRSNFISQIFVEGNGLETFCVAVIVPDVSVLQGWAEKNHIEGDIQTLCTNEVVKSTILEDCIKFGKEAGLKGFEQVKAIYLHPELFSTENGLLTPTLKTIRPALRKYFEDKVAEMYQKSKK